VKAAVFTTCPFNSHDNNISRHTFASISRSTLNLTRFCLLLAVSCARGLLNFSTEHGPQFLLGS